jgi:cytosol alanyl aminopeptidase
MIGSDKIDVPRRRSLFAGSICSTQRSPLRTLWRWTNANPLAIVAVCLIAALFAAGVAAKAEEAAPSFRLPDLARPTHYTLDMTIVASEPEFHGVAMIDVELKRATDVVWLNQKGLTVQQARVRSGGAAFRKVQWETSEEFLKLKLPTRTGPGKIEFEITYDGMLNDKASVGPYRKKAGDDWYVYTSFTPIDARRAFPCFDEPGYKAPWAVTLHVKKSDIAVANGPEVSSTEEANGMKRVVFKETQPLASEVVAFAVGPFDVVDAGVAGEKRIPVRIITPRGRGGEAGPAKAATAELLPREEAYTGIPYPWDKLDHIAVLDLPFGATENPGLITYRDSQLLSPVSKDTPQRVRAMRGTMAHEMAHQWFGDLVTQAWWDDTWLAEGFATWMAAKVDEVDLPENERGLAVVQARDRMMTIDAKAKRPVQLEMRSRAEMEDVYDGLVYQKGAATLKMVEDWVGADAFQQGIRRYLQEHAMGNATTAEFEKDIEEESGVKVTPVLDGMLTRIGYPVMRFKLADQKLIVDQEMVGGGDVWAMPVCIHLEKTPHRCEIINAAHTEIPLDGITAIVAGRRNLQTWVWTNAYGSGYYRSVLGAGMLDALIGRGYTELSGAERLNVLVDVNANSK